MLLHNAAGAFGPQLVRDRLPVVGGVFALCGQVIYVLRVHQVGRVRARCAYHLAQRARIVQQRTGAQVVARERLMAVILHEQRRLVRLKQRLFMYVGVGVVNERARLYIAIGVYVQVNPNRPGSCFLLRPYAAGMVSATLNAVPKSV